MMVGKVWEWVVSSLLEVVGVAVAVVALDTAPAHTVMNRLAAVEHMTSAEEGRQDMEEEGEVLVEP